VTRGNDQRLEEASGLSRRLLALLVGLLATLALIVSGAPPAAAQNVVGPQHQQLILTVGIETLTASTSTGVHALPQLRLVSATGVAADTGGVDIGGARFAQKSYSETFSKGGLFVGQTIDDVAGQLESGALSPKDVPINVVVRDGSTLITNTRSAQALIRAGIPRGLWNVVNQTGNPLYENLLSGQLSRNGLTSSGYDLPP
jgi:hypothetical protein